MVILFKNKVGERKKKTGRQPNNGHQQSQIITHNEAHAREEHLERRHC